MNRRKYLVTLAGVSSIALAGCSEEETTTASSDDDGNGDSSDDDGNGDSSDDDGNGDSSDDDGGLVIEEHELVEGDYTVQIEGILRNDTGEEQSYVEVKSTVYDEDDVRINDFFTNTTDLPNEERWRFEIPVTADVEDIDRYELEASTSAF